MRLKSSFTSKILFVFESIKIDVQAHASWHVWVAISVTFIVNAVRLSTANLVNSSV